MRPVFIVLLVLVLAAPALAAEKITFTTKDGMKITGTLYASGRKGAAAVVALPMYRHTRETYEPVAERFVKAGMDFLAIDMRGHGESAVQGDEDLSKRVNARDAKLFNAMWQDALAARDFLIGKGSDENRIGFLGASVGCSVAIDAASREEKIPGVCVMTPGMNYLGVDTSAHLKGYRNRPMLVLSSKEEADVGARRIAMGPASQAELVLFDEKNIHGTKMFGVVAGVEDRIVKWFDLLLAGRVALDGKLDAKERFRHPAGRWKGEDGREVVFYAAPRGRHWHVVAVPVESVPAPGQLELALKVDDRGWSIRWNAAGGTWLRKMLRDGKWMPYRTKAAPGPGPSAARGKVIEMLIPMRKGFPPGPNLRVRVTAKLGDADVTSGWKALSK